MTHIIKIKFLFIVLFLVFLAIKNGHAQLHPKDEKKRMKVVMKEYAKKLSTRKKRAIELYIFGEKEYLRRNIKGAIEYLKKAITIDEGFIDAYLRLAAIYIDIGQVESVYPLLIPIEKMKKHNEKTIESYYLLGRAALEQENYKKALPYVEKYLNSEQKRFVLRKKMKENASLYLENIKYALKNMDKKSHLAPKLLPKTINSFQYQYFPSLTADEQSMIYTVLKGHKYIKQEDIYISTKTVNGAWSKGVSISKQINSNRNNEGTSCISADGKYLIFTICNDTRVLGKCDLFVSENIGGIWLPPKNLGPNVNTKAWESQPSITSDGNTLYFSSDRKGGIGKRDIYVSYRDDSGEWSKAKNLGDTVNTKSDDLAPFIFVDNRTLYFSSNGHPGYGNFDLYKTTMRINADSTYEDSGLQWLAPENLGYPINNFKEQTGLIVNSRGDTAYFSNENNNKQEYLKGAIYTFEMPASIKSKNKSTYIKGVVRDSETKKPIEAQIQLFVTGQKKAVLRTKSDPMNGKYLIVLTEGNEYQLYTSRKGYMFKSQYFKLDFVHLVPIEKNVLLEPLKKGNRQELKYIYFDTDSYVLKEKSITALKKLYDLLSTNPTFKIRIEGYTDDIGTSSYNMKLSIERAKAVYSHLLTLGIDTKRMSYKGFGEEKYIRGNDTETGRQQNRRIEFVIE